MIIPPESRPRQPRLGYLDWMRGLAVLVMIEAHVLDSWTRVADRQSRQFLWAMVLGGMGAPLFLFLAGVAVALSAGSKARRTGDVAASARVVAFRGLEIFALAFLFRLQAWVLGWSSPRSLLKVDILNIMGPSIAAAALLWGMFRSPRARGAAFAAALLGIALAAPIVRATPWLDGLPDPVEGYIRPIAGLSNFCLFPWAGFLFAGAVVGVAIDEARTRDAQARLNARLFAAGVALAAAAYAASWLPSPYARSDFWGGSPAFFLLRVGVVAATMAVAYAWVSRAAGWSPLQQLGRTSLFIYWIHVEMVYGLISLGIHKRLSHRAAWGALAAFWVFMLACSVARDRVVDWWRRRRSGSTSAAFAGIGR